MRVVSCLDPQDIINPYTHEHLRVRCGKCRACRNALAKRWINKLEQEKRAWKYCYFVTLTYDNNFLPRLYFDNSSFELYDPNQDSVRIPYADLIFSTNKDFKYFQSRINHSLGIPYNRVRDLQLFHKRLNKIIHDKYTKTYKNFRYFVCSEYGKDTFRPHYHGLYFFSDRRVSDHFQEILSQAWSVDGVAQGRFDAQIVLGSATSYVAQYINMFSDLPSVYQNREIKPFYIFSKHPSIGSVVPLDSEVRKIFFDGTPTRVQYDINRNEFVNVRIPYSLENRLFPRLPKYSEIDVPLRVGLYGLAGKSNAESFEEFKSFLNGLKYRGVYDYDFINCSEYGKRQNEYLRWLTNGFLLYRSNYLTDEDYNLVNNRLKRFYYISNRVCTQASAFGISLSCYVSNIDKYYKNLETYHLKQFYAVQEKYSLSHDIEDISLMYDDPEYYLYFNQFEYVPDISDTYAYKDLKLTSDKIYNDSTKTHHKNDYLDRCRDKKLSLILKDYFL